MGWDIGFKGSKVTLWLFATWRKPYQIGYNIALIKVFAYTAESCLHFARH